MFLVNPSRYEAMTEALEDYALYFEAEKRSAAAENSYIPSEQILSDLGINESDLDGLEAEIE